MQENQTIEHVTTSTVAFTPVVVTAETLQIIYRQPQCDKLIALYMAYVETSTRQQNTTVRATREFVAKKLGWKKETVSRYKSRLAKLGLIRDICRRGEDGKVVGYYVKVFYVANHPVAPLGGQKPSSSPLEGLPVEGTPNTIYYKENSNTVKFDKKAEGVQDEKAVSQEAITNIYRCWLYHMVADYQLRYRHEKGSEEAKAAVDEAAKRYRLTPARREAIARRLKDAGPAMLVRAIINISESDFHRGDNDRGWKADLAKFLCRSYEMVEEWANRQDVRGDAA